MPITKKKISFIFNLFGGCLAILSVYFVIRKLSEYSNEDVRFFLNHTNVFTIVLISVCYGCFSLLLGCVWKNILGYVGEFRTFGWAITINGITQLAKYVPGNIMHLASRQAISVAAGANGNKIAKSIFIELVILLFVGGTIGVMVLPSYLNINYEWVSWCVYLCVLVSMVFVLSKFLSIHLAKAFVLQTIFTLLTGVAFLITLRIVDPIADLSIEQSVFIIACYVSAWLIGLVTPGAPAGLGIREYIIVYLLSGLASESNLLLAVIISRGITVLGDFFYFIIALILKACRGSDVENQHGY